MAAKFTSEAEADLTCPVCFQCFVKPHEPKNLPKCSHIFCLLCLKKMTEKGQKEIACPQCKTVSTVPEEGLDGFPTILAVRNLAERHPKGINQRKQQMHDSLDHEKQNKGNQLKKLEDVREQIDRSVKEGICEIEKSVEAVVTQAKELIDRMKESNQPQLAQIQERVSQLQTQIETLEVSKRKLDEIPDEEFLEQTDTLENEIKKQQSSDLEPIQDPQIVAFIANDADLGRFVRIRRLSLDIGFEGFQYAYGIATKPDDGSLAVTDCHSDKLKIALFRNVGGHYKNTSQISLASAKNTHMDLAVSHDNKYLVTRYSAGFDVISYDGKYQKTVSVLKPGAEQHTQAKTISIVATDKDILTGSAIAPNEIKDSESLTWVITVHDATSGYDLQKYVRISIRPVRIAAIRDTHVAVSDGSQHKVCVYDLQSGKETLSLNIPSPLGICYDKQSDCMLIGRAFEKETSQDGEESAGSCVIAQYCSNTGKLVACLAQGLRAPVGMTITKDDVLAVTDNKKILKFYNIY